MDRRILVTVLAKRDFDLSIEAGFFDLGSFQFDSPSPLNQNARVSPTTGGILKENVEIDWSLYASEDAKAVLLKAATLAAAISLI